MGMVPGTSLAHSNAPFSDAARIMWGRWGAWVIAATAMISCFGTLNGWLLMQGQFPKAVAEDGLFPQFFARGSLRGSPAMGMIVSSILATILILMNYSHGLVAMFNILILLTTFFVLVPYMFCAMAEVVLSRDDKRVSTWRSVRNIALACVAFAFALWAAKGTGKDSLYWGTLLLLLGVPIYVWQKRRQPMPAALRLPPVRPEGAD